VGIGGNMYARLGQFDSYFTHRAPEEFDFGRFNLTGKEEDRFRFRVPGLRNVARTAPYFHDGGVATLPEAVDRIARSQLGVQLSPAEIDLIVAFLESLTGPLPEAAP
jgi:cytochrome c peroxidase